MKSPPFWVVGGPSESPRDAHDAAQGQSQTWLLRNESPGEVLQFMAAYGICQCKFQLVWQIAGNLEETDLWQSSLILETHQIIATLGKLYWG